MSTKQSFLFGALVASIAIILVGMLAAWAVCLLSGSVVAAVIFFVVTMSLTIPWFWMESESDKMYEDMRRRYQYKG